MYSQMQLLADMFYPPLLFVKPSMLTKMVHGALRGATGASNAYILVVACITYLSLITAIEILTATSVDYALVGTRTPSVDNDSTDAHVVVVTGAAQRRERDTVGSAVTRVRSAPYLRMCVLVDYITIHYAPNSGLQITKLSRCSLNKGI